MLRDYTRLHPEPVAFRRCYDGLDDEARSMLSQPAQDAYARGLLSDLAYADDTLLLGVASVHLTEYLQAVETAGKSYGLEMHADKFKLLQVRCCGQVHLSSGEPISAVSSLNYLGATLDDAGQVSSELYCRIGIAKNAFQTVTQVWNHAAIAIGKKVDIYKFLVESKLLHGLASLCLTTAQLRHLDGFQAKCLRSILKIPSAFYSRISNAEVLGRASHRPASALLLQAQLALLGKIIRSGEDSVLRSVSFIGDTLRSATNRYIRRVGRPRKEWIQTVLDEALRRVRGDSGHLLFPATDKAR